MIVELGRNDPQDDFMIDVYNTIVMGVSCGDFVLVWEAGTYTGKNMPKKTYHNDEHAVFMYSDRGKGVVCVRRHYTNILTIREDGVYRMAGNYKYVDRIVNRLLLKSQF